MNKKLLFFSFLLVAITGVVFKMSVTNETEIDKLRKQHAEYLKNHPFQKTAELSKKQRKAQGLPPNAYFEQKYLSEINPSTGRTHKENVHKLQEELNKRRAGLKVPGEADNAWVERGPDNVGGRTRALIFDPNDTTKETVFAGGVSGGLWKNTNISNPDSKWVRVGIPENLAVSCIVIDPNNSKTFYVGTGESYVNGDVNGDGLWKSTDGGNSWVKIFGGVTSDTKTDFNSSLKINSPSDIAGDFISVLTTNFGTTIDSAITNDLVLVDDGTDTADDGCEVITNSADLNGKIAVIRRGACNFTVKAKNAQDAGAIAVIIVNNIDTRPFNMGGTDEAKEIKIPSIMISKTTGESIISKLSSKINVNVTITKLNDNAVNSFLVSGIQHINDVVVRKNGGVSEIYVAAGESGYTGGVSLGGDSMGVYKSIDGVNFEKLNFPKTSSGNSFEPNNVKVGVDNTIYVSTTNSFSYGNGGGAIFKSIDGINFTNVYNVPEGLRTEISVSSKTPGVIYVLAQTENDSEPVKMFKTTNSFTSVTSIKIPIDIDQGIPITDFTRGQAFYDLLVKIDPNNDNIVYVGGIDLFKSIDGGTSWKQISKWSNNNSLSALNASLVHADQHGIAFANSNKMIYGNDGGVYFSNDGGASIVARNKNYNTLQFYTVGVAPTTAFSGDEYFIAGAQDNGSQLVEKANTTINSSRDVLGGDGAASFFDTDGNDKYYIANYVYNSAIELYNYDTDKTITINEEDGSNGDFINQEELDSNLDILYSNYSSGTNFIVRRYVNIKETPGIGNLVNSLMNSEPSKLKVSPYTTLSSTLYIGLKNSKLLKVENANRGIGSWSDITGEEFVGSISDIEFGENENQILVTMHNYGVKSIWYSEDGGETWVNKEGNLPDIPVKAILQNPLNTKEVIIGTDLGVWKTSNFNDTSPTWAQSYNGMSNVPVLDLDLRDDNTVFAATYGRGIFSGKFIFDPNGDDDGDGVLNGVDNCPNTANPDQKDFNNDGIGDVCQDSDEDGVMDSVDNCPTVKNPNQEDSDNDGVGDACKDSDGDGITDDVDNCIDTVNPDQKDFNNDGIGDVCQDSDGDGVMDNVDNCPAVANPDQKDTDGNGIGDVCQDTDGDGIIDIEDNCPTTANPDQKDTDGNGIGDACQDTDEDGIMDNVDNCLTTKNPDQKDGNGDGVGDVCDTSYKDRDNISVKTTSETCQDQNDGKITVNVKQTFVSYTVTVKGTSTDLTKQLTTSSVEFTDLAPGTYDVCVKVNDRDDFTQCYQVTIDASSPVSLKVAKNEASRSYTVNVTSGTAPYTVYLNGNLVDTFNTSTFNVNVEGSGVLEVKTAKACEGKSNVIIDNIFLKRNPVSNTINLLLPNDAKSKLNVRLYDIKGKIVLEGDFEKQGNELSIPFEGYNSGTYLLKVGYNNTNTFKVLKR